MLRTILLFGVAVGVLYGPSGAWAQEGPGTVSLEEPVGPPGEDRKVQGIVGLGVGGGKVDEDHMARNGLARINAEAGLLFEHGLSLMGSYRFVAYRKEYISKNANPAMGDNARIELEERYHDAALCVGFNPLFKKTQVIELPIILGPRFTGIDNRAFATWAGGLILGAGAVVRPSDNFHLMAGGSWSMGFVGEKETLSIMGLPRQFWDAQGGFGIDFDAGVGWALEFKWQGSWVVFEHSQRDYQAAIVGVKVTI